MTGKIIHPISSQSEGHYLLRVMTDVKEALPGQFISVKIGNTNDPFLRRPFSIFDFSNGTFEVIFQVVGKGTALLSEYNGSEIDILGPLGNGFTILDNAKVLLIGGGAGNAPLHFLSKTLKKHNCEVTQIYGSRTANVIYCKDRFCSSSDNVIFMTDDGSAGEKGFVTSAAAELLSKTDYDMIYTCGPKPMLKSIAELLSSGNITCEVSLENYFGCGTGICYGCTIRTRHGNKRVCTDGPVFNLNELDFSLL